MAGTATEHDIRAWAEEYQVDLVDGQITPDIRRKFLESKENGGSEKAPTIPKPSPVDRLKTAVKRADPPSAKRATTRHVRVSVDRIIGRAWGFLAKAAQPINLPVARVLTMQSPVAGAILEDVIAGTPVDKILQPIARFEEKGELAFALVGPPVLVAAITARPGLAPVLIPMLRDALRTWIVIAGPKLKKIQEQEQKFQEEYGIDIDAMIEMLFAPPDVSGDANGVQPS